MDLIEQQERNVRLALRLPEDPNAPPSVDRMALYRAVVNACASDGSTVDVTPDSDRLTPMQAVRVRVGVPGLTAVVQPGAPVLVGWEGADPAKPYALPAWEPATVTKLVFAAAAIFLGAEAGAKPVGLNGDTVNAAAGMATWMTSITNAVNGLTGGAIAVPLTFGTLHASATKVNGV